MSTYMEGEREQRKQMCAKIAFMIRCARAVGLLAHWGSPEESDGLVSLAFFPL